MSNAHGHSRAEGYDCYDLPDENEIQAVDDTSSVMANFSRSNNPDIILHQPTNAGHQNMYSAPWTYSPSGSRPLERQDYHCSMKSINNIGSYSSDKTALEKKDELVAPTSLSAPAPPGAIHPGTSAFGSRDWSSDIFASFQEVRKSKTLCAGLKAFCLDCLCVPCMMCDTAKSLGDKAFLPFIPGTGAAIRFKVRILGGIQGSIADDCVMTSCCCPCAVCQMYKEIEDIGLGAK